MSIDFNSDFNSFKKQIYQKYNMPMEFEKNIQTNQTKEKEIEQNKNKPWQYYFKKAAIVGIATIPITLLMAYCFKRFVPNDFSKINFLNIGKLFDENSINGIKNNFVRKRTKKIAKKTEQIIQEGKKLSYLTFVGLHTAKVATLDFLYILGMDKIIKPALDNHKNKQNI